MGCKRAVLCKPLSTRSIVLFPYTLFTFDFDLLPVRRSLRCQRVNFLPLVFLPIPFLAPPMSAAAVVLKPHQQLAVACIRALPATSLLDDDLVRLVHTTSNQNDNFELWQARCATVGIVDWVVRELLAEQAHANHSTLAIVCPNSASDPTLKAHQRLMLWLVELARAVSPAQRRTMTLAEFVARETSLAARPEAWLLRTHSKSTSEAVAEWMRDNFEQDDDRACVLGWGKKTNRQPRMLAEIADYLTDAPMAIAK
jgi:hypothetical protein